MKSRSSEPMVAPHDTHTKVTLFDERLAVHHWTCREPKGRILLVHGLGEHVGRYQELTQAWHNAGFEIMGVDLPGHGLSTGRRGDIPDRQQLWNDLDTIRGQWSDLGSETPVPEFLYGHSLGAHLVMLYVLKRKPQIAGVIASSPLLAAAIRPPFWKLALAHSLGRVFPSMTVHNGLKPRDISHLPSEIQAYQSDPLHHTRISARLGLESLRDCQWLRDHANQWSRPLLLMHGSGDRITSFEASRDFAKQAGSQCCFVEWPDGRHELHHDTRKAEVFETLFAWLDARIDDTSTCLQQR